MDAAKAKEAFLAVSVLLAEKADELTELDQQNGDGDLGVSMKNGFGAVVSALQPLEEPDLGKLFLKASSALNEGAPSTLGTLLSFLLMGMAKALKGKTEASLPELSGAMEKGLQLMMERAGSKPGEKTVLDSLVPAVEALSSRGGDSAAEALRAAAEAAERGAENTRDMRSVHGRAAYYGDKSIGILDGGAVAGAYLFRALADWIAGN